MKRILPFGAGVLVAAGFGFLPMIGCLSSSESAGSPSDQEGQGEDDADVPRTPEAARVNVERARCGTNGRVCCANACCFHGSVCVRGRYFRTCMKHPRPGSVIIRDTCEVE